MLTFYLSSLACELIADCLRPLLSLPCLHINMHPSRFEPGVAMASIRRAVTPYDANAAAMLFGGSTLPACGA